MEKYKESSPIPLGGISTHESGWGSKFWEIVPKVIRSHWELYLQNWERWRGREWRQATWSDGSCKNLVKGGGGGAALNSEEMAQKPGVCGEKWLTKE